MDEPPAPPKRSLGQNFLVDQNIQRRIVTALGAGPDDVVLEVGPGRGALTRHLAGTVRQLVLVELDDELSGELADRYAGRRDVTVVHGDILEVDIEELTRAYARVGEVRIVGNIPYNITSPIVFHLLRRPRPLEIVLMVQEEVADRIVARVGTKAYGALSIGVRSVARAERLFTVGKRVFRPVPGVDSAVIRIRPIVPEPLTELEEARLRWLVRSAFQWRRKQLRRILRDHGELGYAPDVIAAAAERAGVSPADRPERLSPEQFVSLAAALPQIEPSSNL